MKIDMQYGKGETTVTVERIMSTSYDDGTSWSEYSTPIGLGYEITTEYEEGEECKVKIDPEKLTNKKSIYQCSNYLGKIIEQCRQSDNDMWFVEWEDLQEEISLDKEVQEDFLDELNTEIEKLGLKDYVKTYEDDCAVTVYGGVITEFLFM